MVIAKRCLLLLSICAIFLIVACGNNGDKEETGDAGTEVVATVNGEDIFRSDINEAALREGFDLESEQAAEIAAQVEPIILDQLIRERLLLNEADDQNIKVTEEEVTVHLDQMKEEAALTLPEDMTFDEVLEMQGLTEDSLREHMEQQLKVRKLLELEHIDKSVLAVTEEEKREYYEQLVAQHENIDEYEVLEDEIEHYLMQVNYLENLQENADIETFI
ncbi:SurA N-terminal domain-containing protein [Evansella sp. AB-rgal1]|uniref:SurA N-terminal domain-containing protein n=1 Tax=Evansella sp. AB-rgal1 TaxID=3242696 RepID=UPI00359CCC87